MCSLRDLKWSAHRDWARESQKLDLRGGMLQGRQPGSSRLATSPVLSLTRLAATQILAVGRIPLAKGGFSCLLHCFSDQARGLLWRDHCNTYLQVERRMLLDQHLYPPNIAETLAALQRGPEALQPGSSSRYALQVCPHQAHATVCRAVIIS